MPKSRTNAHDSATATDPAMLFKNQSEWLSWLHKHHAGSPGVWLQIAKKDAHIESVSYAEALETALCYGWIDAQKRPGPKGLWLQRFTPRRPTSIWSKVNREKALFLVEQGRMQPAGLDAVQRAKENGRWDSAYDQVSAAQIPDDLAAHLRKSLGARAFFNTLSSQNRYAILFRLQTARKPETRAKRLQKFVEMLENHETVHPQSESVRRPGRKR
jgi:uncharacterized protein YdeI (YjbR/CyaY-like superfamily)